MGRAKANERCDQANETLHTSVIVYAIILRSGHINEHIACAESVSSKIKYLGGRCAEINMGMERIAT